MGIGASVPGRKPSVHQKLLIAASAGDTHHHKVVDLLALGAMVNTVDGALRTPLHCAAQIGAEDVCALLVTAKADLQMCDKGGRFARAHTHTRTQTLRHRHSQTNTRRHTQTHADTNSLGNDDRCRMSACFAFSRSASAAADTRGIRVLMDTCQIGSCTVSAYV